MQMTLTLDACTRCGHAIRPGQPVMQTTSVDIIGGRVVASPSRSHHLKEDCPGDGQPLQPTD